MTKGERLKLFREHIGLNQQEFADSIDTSQPHLSSMESGGRSISQAVTFKVAEQFKQLNLDWLQHGRGEMLYRKSLLPTQKHPPNSEITHLIGDFDSILNWQVVSNFDDYVVLKRTKAS